MSAAGTVMVGHFRVKLEFHAKSQHFQLIMDVCTKMKRKHTSEVAKKQNKTKNKKKQQKQC